MIQISEKSSCVGCEACRNRCPRQCITMVEDAEGFLYPNINTNTCINCGLCEQVCPLASLDQKTSPLKAIGASNTDELVRKNSSSGGVFHALALSIISQGGVVFGAIYNEDWSVNIVPAETEEQLLPMLGSKYVQARINNAYQLAESYLKQGRKVLYTGTPCQIAGLHRYLKKSYDNLLSADFSCHGVGSPKVWQDYLDEFCLSRGVANRRSDYIRAISFRDKERGWKNFRFVITTSDGRNLNEFHKENTYMKAFLKNLSLRPSCHACRFKEYTSHSDITLADFWGIEYIDSSLFDDRGISLVIIHTDKGENAMQLQNLKFFETAYPDCNRYNMGLRKISQEHPKRATFFKEWSQTHQLCNTILKYTKVPLKTRLKNSILKIFRH